MSFRYVWRVGILGVYWYFLREIYFKIKVRWFLSRVMSIILGRERVRIVRGIFGVDYLG